MKKATLLKIVNFAIALLFVVLMTTALGSSLLPPVAYDVHRYGGYLFGALILAHIALNWGWVKSALTKKKKPSGAPSTPRG
jgi:hypothetical protein